MRRSPWWVGGDARPAAGGPVGAASDQVLHRCTTVGHRLAATLESLPFVDPSTGAGSRSTAACVRPVPVPWYDRSAPQEAGQPVVFIHAGIADRRMWGPDLGRPGRRPHQVVRVDLARLRRVDDPAGRGAAGPRRRRPLDASSIWASRGATWSAPRSVRAWPRGVASAPARSGAVSLLLLCPPGGSLLAELVARYSAPLLRRRGGESPGQWRSRCCGRGPTLRPGLGRRPRPQRF